jgi:hypothetical protein
MESKFINFNNKNYPFFQAKGNAAQFIIPFAKHYCHGVGYDIGCCKKEWAYPGSVLIDPVIDPTYDAYNLPDGKVNYIFSSHCLEHLQNWVNALEYWIEKLQPGGTLFLYLPHKEQEYWRPWNNRKHIHQLDAEMICSYLKSNKNIDRENIFWSERDLNHSFAIVAFKK